MSAFSDLFETDQQATNYAAPGIPASALSGNPAGTVTNLQSVVGAQAGSALGNALGGAIGAAMGRPMVDPVQMAQNRQQEFSNEIEVLMSQGASFGEAMLEASKSGGLSPEERIKAFGLAQENIKEEQKTARDTSKALYNSDAYKGFVDSKNNWLAMKDLAGKAESINDFTLIQRFLKTIDPDSATLQGEINAAKLSTTGMQGLQNVFGEVEGAKIVANLMRFQAGGGNILTLNEAQKTKLLSAAADVVKAKQRSALAAYDQFQSVYLGSGGSQKLFNEVGKSAFQNLQFSTEGELAEADIAPGNMPNNWLGLRDMANGKRERVNQAITDVAVDGAKFTAMFAADFVVGGGTAAWEAFKNWRDSTFGPDAEPSNSVGSAMTIDPAGTAIDLERTWGQGSTPLNMIMDLSTGGYTAKLSGITATSPVIDKLKSSTGQSGKSRNSKQRRLTGGSF